MNLSYCRFQNTLIDFRECVKAVEDDAELSDAETSAMLDLVTLAAKLVRVMTPKHYTTDSRADASVVSLLRGVIESLVEALDRANSLYPLPMNVVVAVVENARNTLAAMDRA